jgi:hypothetical protein
MAVIRLTNPDVLLIIIINSTTTDYVTFHLQASFN